MRRRDKAVKTRRHKTLTRRAEPKAARRNSVAAGKETNVARLTRELKEAREQQTGTFKVLQVISSSPGELEPVFDAILENATRICGAKFGVLWRRFDDGTARIFASLSVPSAFAEFLQRGPHRPGPFSPINRVAKTRQRVHIADFRVDQAYLTHDPLAVAGVELGGQRTLLVVPMLKEDKLVGMIAIYRQEVRPFTDKQIELVENFAAQAVIAIENARLLGELRQRTDDLSESLEQQTATAEVLRVISSSPTNVQPVFDAIAESAVKLCGGQFSFVVRFDGEVVDFASCCGLSAEGLEAFRRLLPHPAREDTAASRAILRRAVVEIPDVGADPAYGALARDLAKTVPYRSIAAVPLLHEGNPIGAIAVARADAGSFPKRQIVLLQAFADQTVIALENVRLFDEVQARTRELSESLEQQTATAEVLKIISRSLVDLETVLDTLVETVARLCRADQVYMFHLRHDLWHLVAAWGLSAEAREFFLRHPFTPGRGSTSGRAALERRAVLIPDVLQDPEYALNEGQKIAGYRTTLGIPLLREDTLIGVFSIARTRVEAFTEKEIELATTFADQAVIAIENARLFDELRRRTDDLSESLEQQTATSQVLQVISSSPGELEPVFNAMLENATRICDASYGVMFLCEGKGFRTAAMHNLPRAFAEERKRFALIEPIPIDPLARLAKTKQRVHISDARTEAAYKRRFAPFVAAVEDGGVRTLLLTPLLREGALVGAFAIFRQEVRPFTGKQIEFVDNFAAQAVIAIENTRLLNELRQRTDDLSESLQQQIATSEVLSIISTSAGKLQPVFETMLAKAAELCEASFGALWLVDGEGYRTAALHGDLPEAYVEQWRSGTLHRPKAAVPMVRAIRSRKPVHITDMRKEKAYLEGDPLAVSAADVAGIRTLLTVPMLKEREAIGVITIYRNEVRVFSDRQVELISNFAKQAVIAIENTRLLSELRESLQQQTATADVLKVISSSPGQLEPVFRAMLEKAVRICGAKFGQMFLSEGDGYRAVAMHDVPHAFAEKRRQNPFLCPSAGSPLGRVTRTKQVAHVVDLMADQGYESDRGLRELVELGGARTTVAVPMLNDNELVGAISIYQKEVRPFTHKQIELLKNFAAQAVIAIENTRLLNELRESLQQQTATADVLKVISRSTFDLKSVLSTLVESAARLCEADIGNIARPNEGGAFQVEANYGQSGALWDELTRLALKAGKGSVIGRTALNRATVHILDAQTDPDYKLHEAQKLGGYHTMLGVPLLREGNLVGVFGLARRTVRPFTEKQIELVTTFADQAVIAIENARLFDEVQARTRELAASLDDLRTTQDRLVQTQKLALLGQLTAGIAHEIKNPLNFVNNFSGISAELIGELQDTLKGMPLDDKARTEINDLTDTLKSNFDKVVHHGRRADAIVKNMLQHSRDGSGEHRVIDINALVEESLNLAWHGARAETQGFEVKLKQSFDPSAGGADVFPQDIRRALLNLIANGFYAATRRRAETNGGDYEPTVTASTKDLGDRVEVRIRDNGTGMTPDVREKMFNPFFTTKPTGEGTGLGLSISHDVIVKQHAGTIEVDTQPGEFTEIRIVLPRTPAFV